LTEVKSNPDFLPLRTFILAFLNAAHLSFDGSPLSGFPSTLQRLIMMLSNLKVSKLTMSLCVSAIVLIAAIPVVSFAVSGDDIVVADDGFAVVTRGPLEVRVAEVGTVESANNVVLSSQVEWSLPLLSLVEDGEWVEEGDIIAELDESGIRESYNVRQIKLVNAEAALSEAVEALAMQRLKNESMIADAELQVRLSQLQLDGYREAEYPQQLHEKESDVALAEEALSRAEKNLEFVDEMVQLGYRKQSDREAERLKFLKARHALTMSRDQLSILSQHTHERTLTQLKAIAEEAVRELDRVRDAGRAAILSREIKVASRRRSHAIYKAYQERLERNMSSCVVRAPRAGEVIRATVSSKSNEKIADDGYIRSQQKIAMMPDRSRVQVRMRLHESKIRLVEDHQLAEIRIDSIPGKEFAGHVSSVSTVPESGKFPNVDVKEYRVIVTVDADPETAQTLAPGMTAQVTVISAYRPSTIQVPMDAVAEIAGRYVVFVKQSDGNIQSREFEPGVTSDMAIEVVAGLQVNEQVVLRPRIVCAKQIERLEDRYLSLSSIAQNNANTSR